MTYCCLLYDGGSHLKFEATCTAEKIHVSPQKPDPNSSGTLVKQVFCVILVSIS